MRSTSGAAAAITSAIRHMSSASRAPLSRVVGGAECMQSFGVGEFATLVVAEPLTAGEAVQRHSQVTGDRGFADRIEHGGASTRGRGRRRCHPPVRVWRRPSNALASRGTTARRSVPD